MRGSWAAGLGLSVVLVGACSERPPRSEAPASDGRKRLDLPTEAQEAVRLEMRTMLGSLHDLLTAGAKGDTAAMRAAAARSGLATAVDPALEKLLPEEFLQLGTSTHRQFDDLGTAVQRGVAAESVLAGLGRLTGNCVACHASYRFGPR